MKKFRLKKHSDKNKHSALRAMSFFTTGKNFAKILIFLVFTTILLGGFSTKTFAASLDVSFNPNPLFTKPNFLPEDETSGTVTVTNNSGSEQNILTEAINIADEDDFGELLQLKITGDSGVLFDDTLSYFFKTAGEYSLGSISNGETKIFTYTVKFVDSNDNSYQGKTLGFDVCVGFEGGENHCGGTTIGEEHGGGNSGGGSSGGSSGSIVLIIFNEQAGDISSQGVAGSASATITWDTNKLSTSQVIYGLASGGPYNLDLADLPNLGYPFGSVEDPTKVVYHSVLLTGLEPGETYTYRVVSHASPATVSYEHEFTVPLFAQGNNNIFTNNTGGIDNPEGAVLGASTENTQDDTNVNEETESNDSNLATAILGSGSGEILYSCYGLSLLIIVILYLIWRLLLKERYKKLEVSEEEIKTRFYFFFAFASALASLIFIIISYYCPLEIFVVLFVISICFYIYRKLKVK